jgi:hypothetical protein
MKHPIRRSPGTAHQAPQKPNPNSATSQAFHQELPDALLKAAWCHRHRRFVGMVMFSTVQGTVLNFFMVDLNLEERIRGSSDCSGSPASARCWVRGFKELGAAAVADVLVLRIDAADLAGGRTVAAVRLKNHHSRFVRPAVDRYCRVYFCIRSARTRG